MMANTLALGAAYQRGMLPVSAAALEQAIRLNGAAVEKNLAAFAWGRAVVAAPDAVEQATRPPASAVAARELSEAERELVTLAVNGDQGELRRLVELRVPELVAYQDEALRAALRRGSCAGCTWPSRSARPGTPSWPRRSPASCSS